MTNINESIFSSLLGSLFYISEFPEEHSKEDILNIIKEHLFKIENFLGH